MTALPNYPNVIAINTRRTKIAPGNSVYAPLAKDSARQLELAEAERIIAATATQAGMVENASTDDRYANRSLGYGVSLDPPPMWAARRRQMRRDGLHVIACVVMLIALIGFAMTPDTAVVQAQMEDAQ